MVSNLLHIFSTFRVFVSCLVETQIFAFLVVTLQSWKNFKIEETEKKNNKNDKNKREKQPPNPLIFKNLQYKLAVI